MLLAIHFQHIAAVQGCILFPVIYIYVCMYVKYILQIKNTIIIFFLV